jgi:hypothetical protein
LVTVLEEERMAIEILRPVLLTGAGFTKDVGGYLAQEMWAQIFNSPAVRSNDRLDYLLKEDFDYESVYDKVVYGQYSAEEQNAFSDALLASYQTLDERIRNLEGNQSPGNGVDLDKLWFLLHKFCGTENSRGYFFTLNQDLFVERWLSDREVLFWDKQPIWVPGIPNHVSGKKEHPLQEEDILTLPQEAAMTTHRKNNEENISSYGRFQYIKLHGSWNWRTSDGKSAMAIGHAKSSLLAREPLFRWYQDTFKLVVSQSACRLLVIGYGFRDRHINDAIADGIEKHSLKLFIVNPESPEAFRNMLITHALGNEERKKLFGLLIWENGLAGYFQATLSQLCPRDGRMHTSESNLAKQICESVFQ